MLQNTPFKPPFFEIGPKAYLYGDALLDLALAADEASRQYRVTVVFTTPFCDIERIANRTKNLFIVAPHMDPIVPGRGLTAILPEAIKAVGARGVMLNHMERPLTYSVLRKTIRRAEELQLCTLVCADSIAEVKAVTMLAPDVVIPEPSDLIGTGQISDYDYVKTSLDIVHEIDPRIMVLQGAGISNRDDVYNLIMAGADATGSSSAVCTADNPGKVATEMIAAVREAWDKRYPEHMN